MRPRYLYRRSATGLKLTLVNACKSLYGDQVTKPTARREPGHLTTGETLTMRNSMEWSLIRRGGKMAQIGATQARRSDAMARGIALANEGDTDFDIWVKWNDRLPAMIAGRATAESKGEHSPY